MAASAQRRRDQARRTISSFYPTEPTPLAFRRELWQLPLGKDTIQSIAKPYADVRVKHMVDFALEAAERMWASSVGREHH